MVTVLAYMIYLKELVLRTQLKLREYNIRNIGNMEDPKTISVDLDPYRTKSY